MAGDVERHSGLVPRAQPRKPELLTADIHLRTGTKNAKALNLFDQFLCLHDSEDSAGFGWASELVCWDQVMQELSSQLFSDLPYSPSYWECRSPIRACVPRLCGGSTESGYLQCPPSFCIALSVAVLVFFLYNRESLGLSFLLMFHCLLRPGEVRAVECVDVHIFDDDSASRYEGVFGVVSSEDQTAE